MLTVNLTTIDSRLELCSATVWSLMHQSKVPDKIVLWISDKPYLADKGIVVAPDWISQFNRIKNIIIVKYTENTGPYRKIIPALRLSSVEDILVYADDDVIYGKDWLRLLYNKFVAFDRNHVVASRIRYRKKNIFGTYQSYNRCQIVYDDRLLTSDFIITGVGGCILSRKNINDGYISSDEFLSIAEKTDDLWVSKIVELSSTSVSTCPEALGQVHEIQHGIDSLCSANTYNRDVSGISKIFSRVYVFILGYLGYSLTNNDVVLKKLDNYFKK